MRRPCSLRVTAQDRAARARFLTRERRDDTDAEGKAPGSGQKLQGRHRRDVRVTRSGAALNPDQRADRLGDRALIVAGDFAEPRWKARRDGRDDSAARF